MSDVYQVNMDRIKTLLARIHEIDPDMDREDYQNELGQLGFSVSYDDYDYTPKHSPFLYDTWMELLMTIRFLSNHPSTKLRYPDNMDPFFDEVFSDVPPGWLYGVYKKGK